MSKKIPSPIEILVILFTAWQGATLFTSWFSPHPMERYAWIPFTIWILPILYYRMTNSSSLNSIMLGCALFFSAAGMMGSLNAICHVGFACALSALLPLSWRHLIWIPLAISWMPSFGYFTKNFPHQQIFLIRIFLSLATPLLFIKSPYEKPLEVEDEAI